MPDFVSVAEALEVALAGCEHLRPVRYAATVAAARQLARRIDLLAAEPLDGKFDNVTMPTFLKYMDALGLVVTRESQAVTVAAPVQVAADPVAEKKALLVSMSDVARRKLG